MIFWIEYLIMYIFSYTIMFSGKIYIFHSLVYELSKGYYVKKL